MSSGTRFLVALWRLAPAWQFSYCLHVSAVRIARAGTRLRRGSLRSGSEAVAGKHEPARRTGPEARRCLTLRPSTRYGDYVAGGALLPSGETHDVDRYRRRQP